MAMETEKYEQAEAEAEAEAEDMEVVLEKAWDLHDKISDAIHAISRTRFLSARGVLHRTSNTANAPQIADDDVVSETRSLNAIRNALEVLENHLYFLHTLQMQQRTERDVALMRLEESRLMLLNKLKGHRGRDLSVIQEALAFASDKETAEDIHPSPHSVKKAFYSEPVRKECCNENDKPDEDGESLQRRGHNGIGSFIGLSIRCMKNSDNVIKIAGFVAKVALLTAGMLTMLHIQLNKNKTRSVGRSNSREMENNYWSFKNKSESSMEQMSRVPAQYDFSTLDVLHGRG